MKFKLENPTPSFAKVIVNGVSGNIVQLTTRFSRYWGVGEAIGFDTDENGRIQEERKYKFVLTQHPFDIAVFDTTKGECVVAPYLVGLGREKGKFYLEPSVNDGIGLDLKDSKLQEEICS